MKLKSKNRNVLFVITALIWGMAFAAQSVGMDYMKPLTFYAVRSFLGAAVLIPLVVYHRKQKNKENVQTKKVLFDKATWIGGVLCGLALCIASLLQQYGILSTTVGKAGFITTLYIIMVPLFGIFLGKKAGGKLWLGVVIAAAGMYFLCINETFSLAVGDILIFLCAVVFTIQILLVDYFTKIADSIDLAFLQLFVAGIVSLTLAFLFEEPSLSGILAGWIPVVYAGVFSSGIGYTLQVIGQKGADPAIASLIMSLESVFSVLGGFLILHQVLSARELLGCALVFLAVILVQLPSFDRKEKAA